MQRTYIKDIKEQTGSEVMLKGFVHAIRDQGSIKFLILRDVTGSVQAVVLKSNPDVFAKIAELSVESVVELTGLAKEEKQAPGGYEVEARSLIILSKAAPELPIPVAVEKGADEVDVTKRLDWRWLDLRKPEKQKIFRVWTELEEGFRKYFLDTGYFQLYAPSFMNMPSESGAEVFQVKYFDTNAYLAQSPQFYKQMGMAAGMEKVFMTGPVFRAEPSYTTRHMTEFTGWDFEISYIDSHEDVMSEEEKAIVSGFRQLNEALGLELEIPQMPFPKVTMKEAKKMLNDTGVRSEKEHDMSPEEERELSRLIKEKMGSDFVFVTNYSKEVRPFYHMRFADDPDTTMSFDLLYRGVEITTGAQREHRPEVLERQAKEKGMNLEHLEGYISFFRYGCPPHGGAGIGPGRMIMQILSLPSVKEATFLPRDIKRINP